MSEPGSLAIVGGLLDCQTEVLERMAGGAPLPELLDCITGTLELLMPGSRCSILLLDAAEGALRHGSAPSLPQDYLDAIDGLRPAPDAGSCGTSAFLARPVIAVDVLTDPRWTAFRAIATAADLRSCWSSPIIGSAAAVIGTFAVYHREVHEPSEDEHRVVDQLTNLASVVIEHDAMIRALVVSEERFRRAFEDNAVAFALLDTDGRFTRVNDAMVTLTGRSPADAAGLRLSQVTADPAELDELIAALGAGRRRSAQAESVVVRADGSSATVSFSLSLVRGAQSEPLQISVSMLDVTARLAAARERRAREEAELARHAAEDASHAKSAFLSAVGHEMRTPLQAITGFAELIGTLDLDSERRREALRHITTGATHLLALVDDTLDLSRVEAGALPLAVETLPVRALVNEVVDFLAPVADRHEVGLAAGPVAGAVRADARRLRQVLINLVSNGIRYSGPGARVRIDAEPGADHVRIAVVDDGPGIAPELRGRLFEPFVHGNEPAAGPGIGLGLMLARGLAEAMGGRLTLGDGAAGGTVATVTLPAG